MSKGQVLLRWHLTLHSDFMRIILFLIISLLLSEESFSQDNYWDLYEQRVIQNDRNKNILLGWGAANVVSGIALYNSDYRDFGLMNASWGAINMGIAIMAKRNAQRFNPDTHSISDIISEELRFNRIVALNTGLDVGYMGAGWAMMHFGEDSITRQFGTSVLIQGAFLFAYDLFLLIESSRYLNELIIFPDMINMDGLNIESRPFPVLTLQRNL